MRLNSVVRRLGGRPRVESAGYGESAVIVWCQTELAVGLARKPWTTTFKASVESCKGAWEVDAVNDQAMATSIH